MQLLKAGGALWQRLRLDKLDPPEQSVFTRRSGRRCRRRSCKGCRPRPCEYRCRGWGDWRRRYRLGGRRNRRLGGHSPSRTRCRARPWGTRDRAPGFEIAHATSLSPTPDNAPEASFRAAPMRRPAGCISEGGPSTYERTLFSHGIVVKTGSFRERLVRASGSPARSPRATLPSSSDPRRGSRAPSARRSRVRIPRSPRTQRGAD